MQVLTGYLERVLRSVVSEARESKVHRALSAGRYLQVEAAGIQEVERIGPLVDYGDEVRLVSELDRRERRRLFGVDRGRDRGEEEYE